jgi:uncharacterized protein YdeI (YjbR/CyaY-like superfamily)
MEDGFPATRGHYSAACHNARRMTEIAPHTSPVAEKGPPNMIMSPDDYITKGCGRVDTPARSVHIWSGGPARLRTLCRDLGLTETKKWGHPFYMHASRNIAILGAFQSNYPLIFFNAALLRHPQKLLKKQGPNAQPPSMLRFTDDHDIKAWPPMSIAIWWRR